MVLPWVGYVVIREKDIYSIFQVFEVPLDAAERVLELGAGPLGLGAGRAQRRGRRRHLLPAQVQPARLVQSLEHLTTIRQLSLTILLVHSLNNSLTQTLSVVQSSFRNQYNKNVYHSNIFVTIWISMRIETNIVMY